VAAGRTGVVTISRFNSMLCFHWGSDAVKSMRPGLKFNKK
jgi:hypothetical protein